MQLLEAKAYTHTHMHTHKLEKHQRKGGFITGSL